MMHVRVRRVGVRSVFLIFLVIYGLVGVLVGAGVGVLATLDVGPEAGTAFLDRLGWWSLVVFPLLYGLLGALAGAVAAILYNAAAAVTGGVKLDLRVATEVEVEGGGQGRKVVLVEAGGEE